MGLPDGTFDLGPESGRLLIYTGRTGLAARVGHDLTITFARWSGRLTLHGDDLGSASVTATIATDSIAILDGTGGALPLIDRDRREIGKTARRLLDTDRQPSATYASTSIARDGDGATVDGMLTVRGRSAPVSLTVVPSGKGWRASTSINQTSFGIAPYQALLGALRLADEMRIEVEVELAAVAR
jgi:polyisoprenoid-binding protein YceI